MTRGTEAEPDVPLSGRNPVLDEQDTGWTMNITDHAAFKLVLKIQKLA